MELKPLLRLGWLRWGAAAGLLVALAVASGLWLQRRAVVDGELRALAALARAMALQADRTLGIADSTLRATRDELARRLIVPGTPEADALLRDRVRPLQGFRALWLFDAEGRRIAGSPGEAAPAGPALIEAVRAAASPTVTIATPPLPAEGGRAALAIALDWHDDDGRLRGALALLADADVLDGDFDRIAPTADTQLGVHRLDGTLLPAAVAGGAPAAAPLLPAAQVQRLRIRAGDRVAEQLAGSDGRPRLVAAAALGRHPLTVVVSRDAATALAGWTRLAWWLGGFTAVMLAVMAALALRTAFEQLRRERLELRLQRSQKLEAMGRLAGGVAHDFNNLLAAVIGFGEMARDAAPAGSRQAANLDQLLQAGQRGRQFVERVLAASHGQPLRPTPFRPQPVVAEVLDHLAAAMPEGVEVERGLRGPALAVRGDAGALYQAAMNLCRNALQAMTPAGGRLGVELDEEQVQQPRLLYDSTLAPGRYVRLRVSDTGGGMSAEVLAHLFEPFFSTKAGTTGPQGGSGLGLAVVHGVVAEMHGAIDVRSEPGRGSAFTLYLPACEPPPAAEPVVERPAAPQPPQPLPRGRGQTVLVVDDEPALVALAEEMLAELGYEPYGRSSSLQALADVSAEPGRFDLLFTDELMPGLGGTALASAVRALRPTLPVVLASGFGGSDLQARARAAGIAVVVAKPLTRAGLARALASALEGAGEG